ncbi:probable adenylate kinase 7, mitochondrial [Actinidia eriantha]|uniref:probable adenylate kinase 7, mitochondrial n=1 Tax=Actinidia eriantha TaxID=165200 RepID=UPI00258A5101|nr:probable adenylate kinase 7, mitochondrial [Actinidia eriantha]
MARISGPITSATALRHLRSAAPLITRLLQSFATSAFAAAQPQLDHDYHYYNHQNASDTISQHNEMRSSPMVDSEGFVPLRGVQWAFIGNPGAKRHVYAEKLSKLLEVPHISIGSLVRQDLSPRSSLYRQIARAINQGKLVPEEIIFRLLSKRLEDGFFYKGETGFILDGIPRTRTQAEILDELVDIDLVVNFKCGDCLLEHPADSLFSHSHQPDCLSGSASEDTSKYSFCDSGSALKGKTHIYAKQMKLLEDYYNKQKKLIDFQVRSAPGETWKGLLAALHLQHINAASSRLTSGSSWV